MERNSKLFYAIADSIEREPERYDQDMWAYRRDPDGGMTAFIDLDDVMDHPEELLGDCGTVYCVAGWAVIHMLAGVGSDWEPMVCAPCGYPDWEETGRRALGLTEDEEKILFEVVWRPAAGMTVSDALRAIGDGASIESVTHPRGTFAGLNDL